MYCPLLYDDSARLIDEMLGAVFENEDQLATNWTNLSIPTGWIGPSTEKLTNR